MVSATTYFISTGLCEHSSGTFLYDTARERQNHKGETQSLWSYLAQPEVTHPLQNPLYDRNSSVLLLSLSHLTVVRIYIHVPNGCLTNAGSISS